jgi:hypothetical protein
MPARLPRCRPSGSLCPGQGRRTPGPKNPDGDKRSADTARRRLTSVICDRWYCGSREIYAKRQQDLRDRQRRQAKGDERAGVCPRARRWVPTAKYDPQDSGIRHHRGREWPGRYHCGTKRYPPKPGRRRAWGLSATLLASCMGLAILSTLGKGVGQTTLEFKISLVRPTTPETGLIIAEGLC